jgi:hypothetical protein
MRHSVLKIGLLVLFGAALAAISQASPARSVGASPLPVTTPEPPVPEPTLPTESEGFVMDERASQPFRANDARLNDQPWASAAVYCQQDGIQVLGIDAQGNGFLAFTVSRSRIDRLGISPTANIRLGASQGDFGEISLWRLSSGEFQLHAPGLPPETAKSYDFVFPGCS